MNTIQPRRTVIISRDDAMEILADFLPIFRDCLDQAWQSVEQLLTENAECRTAFSSTTLANMLYDRQVQLVRQSLDRHSRVVLRTRGRMLRLIVDHRLLIRFKKLDDALLARNVHTDSQRLDYFQNWLPSMEDAKLTKLTFGYRLNETATKIMGRYVTCSKSWGGNHWSAALDEPASDALPLLAPSNQPDGDGNSGIVITPKRAMPAKGSASA